MRSFMPALSLRRLCTCSCRKPLSAFTRLSWLASSCHAAERHPSQLSPNPRCLHRMEGAVYCPLITSILSVLAWRASSAMSMSAHTSGHGTTASSCCR